MTQIATVERILDSGYAEISVPRKSACGHDCEECAGCGMTGASIYARAKNLPDAQREVITLFYLQDLKIKEIAEILGKPENTVKVTLMRAREALKSMLEG